jgi:hypothetical protein
VGRTCPPLLRRLGQKLRVFFGGATEGPLWAICSFGGIHSVRPYPSFSSIQRLSEGDIRTLARQEHERCRDEGLKALEKILRLERVPLYTQNIECLQAEASKWLSKYVGIRWPEELPRISYADELNVMAKVQAYFQVAYKVGSI